MPEPNFFLVGAPKAGTTSLYWYLSQHPSVFVSPVKEPDFFASELQRSAGSTSVSGWTEYLRHFSGATNETAIGEGSVAYLASLHAAAAIHARVPKARVMMMLRDPAARLFAHYTAAVAAGATTVAFVEWLERHRQDDATREQPSGPIWAGRYQTHLLRYLSLFSPQHIHVALYDDYVRAPADVIREMFRFLDVAPDDEVDMRRRHNVTVVPRWPALQRAARPLGRLLRPFVPGVMERARRLTHAPLTMRMSTGDRRTAIALYEQEILGLQPLIGRDLSAWLSDGAPAPDDGAPDLQARGR
jgi:hypothetical protein